jgi:hypothetical protein
MCLNRIFLRRKSKLNEEIPQKKAAYITVTVQTAEVNQVRPVSTISSNQCVQIGRNFTLWAIF